jgi:hypothetical protein
MVASAALTRHQTWRHSIPLTTPVTAFHSLGTRWEVWVEKQLPWN